MNFYGNQPYFNQSSPIEEEGVFPAMTAPVIHLGPDGHIRAVNRSFLSESGYDVGEVVGNSVLFLVHPDSLDKVTNAFSKCLSGEDSFCTVEAVLKSGDISTYNALNTPVWDSDGQVRSIVVVTWAAPENIGAVPSADEAHIASPVVSERRQAVNLNDCIRQVAGIAGGDDVVLSLSPRVPHTMTEMGKARGLAQALLLPTENDQANVVITTRRSKGTIVVKAVYEGPASDPVQAPFLPGIRKAAAEMSGGFHVQASPDGGSEITVTLPILLPEKS